MKQIRWAVALILLVMALVGCQQAPVATLVPAEPTVAPTEEPTAAPTEEPVVEGPSLQIEGPDGIVTVTMAELQELPITEGWGGIKSSTGRITPPELFKGVALSDLWELVGPYDDSYAMNVVAKDGYGITFSFDQVANGNFITFDPATGDEVTRDEDLIAIVAFERDGEPIPEDTDGSMRLIIVSEEMNQVTDGHWAVKWVRQIQLKESRADWVLQLEGAITEEMDRATFESGASINCHGASWTDPDGRVWTGIPFYYLLGRVDDDNKHESAAFNYDLAKAGYQVDVIAADGYKITFDSTRLSRNKMILLAYLVDDQPLEEKDFPLRLVGEALDKGEMVGAVARVVLHVDEVSAEEPADDVEVDLDELQAGVLHIMGTVGEEVSLTAEDLEELGLVQAVAEHPKKGPMDYEGVPLSAVLALAAPEADASTALLISGDGYTEEVDAADLIACEECLVTLEEDGLFNLVMPGFESSAWSKDVRLIRFR